MALQSAVKGATHTGQEITWYERGSTTPHNLTGATITGTIENENGESQAITGVLSVTSAAGGVFTWAYSAADVAVAGRFLVQFKATFVGGKYDLSFYQDWVVERAL